MVFIPMIVCQLQLEFFLLFKNINCGEFRTHTESTELGVEAHVSIVPSNHQPLFGSTPSTSPSHPF